jgi:hypothetical protein
LTPAPELSIRQSSPLKRAREDRDEKGGKRVIRTIVTASQVERLIESVKDQGQRSEKDTGQRRLTDYLRKRPREGRRDEELEVVSRETMEGMTGLNAVMSHDGSAVDEEVIEGVMNEIEEAVVEVEDMDESTESAGDEAEGAEESLAEAAETEERVEDVLESGDVGEFDEFSRPKEPTQTAGIEESTHNEPNTSKSDRNLFKSRQRNVVHNLRTIANVSLSSIRSRQTSLQSHRPKPHPAQPSKSNT